MNKTSNKRILISIMGFLPGGAEIMPIRLANYLYSHDYKVGVHCVQKAVNDDIRARLNPNIPVYTTDRFWHLALIILRHHYSVIHSHCVSSQLLVARMKRRLPFLHVRHIATSHGGYEGIEKEKACSLIREVDTAADIWTYVANNNLPLLHKAGIKESKLHKVGNAMEKPSEICPISLAKLNIPKDAYVFTVITRAVPKKCWRETIEAIRIARRLSGENIHLILGGIGAIYDELKKEPLEDFIHLPGEVKNPCDYYKASYCGLLLSVLECAPLGIIEMYQSGVPVVATDTGDVKEMLQCKNGQTGILVSLTNDGHVSPLKSAEAICEMIKNPELYKKCKENAALKASEYSMEHIENEYLNLYSK